MSNQYSTETHNTKSINGAIQTPYGNQQATYPMNNDGYTQNCYAAYNAHPKKQHCKPKQQIETTVKSTCVQENNCKVNIYQCPAIPTTNQASNFGLKGIELALGAGPELLVVESGEVVPINSVARTYTSDIELVSDGVIAIYRSGVYFFNWSVNTESVQAGPDNFAAFGLEINGEELIRGWNPNPDGQVRGSGILQVRATKSAPAYFRLINITNSQIAYAQIFVKAQLSIIYAEK